MFQRILVGTDGSGTAGAAVAHAAELAKLGGSELIVVSAYKQPEDVPPPFGTPEGHHTAEIGKAILHDVEKRYGGDVKLRTVLKEGSPVDAIIDAANDERSTSSSWETGGWPARSGSCWAASRTPFPTTRRATS
jgi:nucleotide-binding universal stress UspA family protein